MLLHACTIFLSAFLLFQVQPIIAKIILPWFGGTAAVWSTCLVFFQVVLLLGYLYAYGSWRYLRAGKQAKLHVLLLGLSLLLLPVIPDAKWKPHGAEDPTFRILGLLIATIGLPYFLLSTTGPLLQAWYTHRFKGAIPYRLFALSNAGSMLALLSYPVLVEPTSAVRRQAQGWSIAYVVFVLLCVITALQLRRDEKSEPLKNTPAPDPRPNWALHVYWAALPACASTLLLAVTNHLSQEVAPIPFLWVLPLSLYLLSFVLCFEGEGWYRRVLFLPLLVGALAGMAYGVSGAWEGASIKRVIPVFAGGLFACCMVCHGELARLKPRPRHLTSFYLMCSLGGALGGVFVALLAPHIFRGYYELPIGIGSCAVLALLALHRDPSSRFYQARFKPTWIVSVGSTLALIVYLTIKVRASNGDSRVMARNFYGELRVVDSTTENEDAIRKLLHGTINHGEQYLRPDRRRQPTTYYGQESGIGLALGDAQGQPWRRVGVIGLGTGTLASYGRAGDYYRFYEINPLVIQLAQTEFSYLKDSKAQVDVVLGDARLSLEGEPNQSLDVLVVDAFSSDSIPVHLLTRESFILYGRHIKATGVLAVHASNKYLSLIPVVQSVTQSLGMEALLIDTDDDEEDETIFGATWILVTGRHGFFERPALKEAGSLLEAKTSVRPWTDDYSNLFRVLK